MKKTEQFDKKEKCVCCDEDISCKKCECEELEIDIKHEKANIKKGY